QTEARSTSSHSHARGQLMGALSGLVSVGLDRQQWVVPAIHAIWIPPHYEHSVRSYGPFSGWSVFITEQRCAQLPREPRAIKTTPLLREAVRRVASWPGVEPRTLSRRFVAETGMTFAQWRQQARLLRALELVADGMPVTTIALELG
ncbi:AraC family transcriptional regulator, partial [Burkholderia gladioli]|uniref:AraC family transcriptional regulator n=1 Tax=Burkholderia gladioli TaxID=28095 RepID=UPI00163FFB70